MINDLPTVFEFVTGRKPVKDRPPVESRSKVRNSAKVNFFHLHPSNDGSLQTLIFGFCYCITRLLFPLFILSLRFNLCVSEINWWTAKRQFQVNWRKLRWRWRWTRWYPLWELRGKLQFWWVLDWLWYLRTVVPRKMCEDNTSKGRNDQAIQMPFLQRKEGKTVD